MRLAFLLLLPCLVCAQLIPAGQPVPKGSNPPVVFLNGYQSGCLGDSGFAPNFGAADKLLQNSSLVSLYFDNCTVSGSPDIEALGAAFGQFLAGLKYADGSAVTQVDVVAHSMGGLVLRSYLAGKQDRLLTTFNPPAVPIRRAVFLGTPHFGSAAANLLGVDKQTAEMALGSQFLFDLNMWNQGNDDLRGISAIAVSGSGGTGVESNLTGFDDGIVTLTSSSLAFTRPGVTRVVPYCHTANTLLAVFGVCKSGTPVLNILSTDPNNLVGQILVSFLTGTDAWKSVGEAAEANALASTRAGVEIQLHDKNDLLLPVINASLPDAMPPATLSANSGSIVYSELLAANTPVKIQLNPLSGSAQTLTYKLAAGTVTPSVVKQGPVIFAKGVVPAAGPAPFPYDVAAGAYVSIYGQTLATTPQTSGVPYPMQLGDVQVLVNGAAAPIQYISAGQINFVYSDVATGLTQLTVRNANGQHTVNVRVASAVPSLFLLDNAAATAAAINVTTGGVVGPAAPLHAGDFVSLYLTGLGPVTNRNGLDYAVVQPSVTLGGQSVTLQYAGRTPGLPGLDQINCQVPAGVTGAAVPVVVSAGGRVSSTAYLNIQ